MQNAPLRANCPISKILNTTLTSSAPMAPRYSRLRRSTPAGQISQIELRLQQITVQNDIAAPVYHYQHHCCFVNGWLLCAVRTPHSKTADSSNASSIPAAERILVSIQHQWAEPTCVTGPRMRHYVPRDFTDQLLAANQPGCNGAVLTIVFIGRFS